MEKRKEGRPGDARAALRRSVRENGCASYDTCIAFLLECYFVNIMIDECDLFKIITMKKLFI